MSDIIVAEFQKNSREDFRVAVGEFKGHALAHVRAWARKDDGTVIPTKNGLSLRLHQIPDLIRALEKAAAAGEAAGFHGTLD
ncbi:transcriptional coactivator p15/PC4 family protein [Flaviflagellibacter deserti]|uniref:Transcriptional coactivator p15/PC4 family protein n=1 Tax=Flaviflagellibacter deserti TaxID=2267266 RepID=A0ABV9Z453_9HYPH